MIKSDTKAAIVLCHMEQNNTDYYYDLDSNMIFYINRKNNLNIGEGTVAFFSIIIYSLFHKYTLSFDITVMYYITVVMGLLIGFIMCVISKKEHMKSIQQERYYVFDKNEMHTCIKKAEKQIGTAYFTFPVLVLMCMGMKGIYFYIAPGNIILSVCNLIFWMVLVVFIYSTVLTHLIKRRQICKMISKQFDKIGGQ